MNKSIYIAKSAIPVWDEASAFGKVYGIGVGPLLVRLLTDFLAKQPKCTCGSFMRPQWKACPFCGEHRG